MRDIALSLPRELVAILEPLLAYRVGDYSLRTSYKSNSSTLSISFDLGQRKRPLVKAPAKTKPKEKKTPAPAPAAPRPVQKARPPTVKKAPPVPPMEIQESLPTTPPPPSVALELATLESRGEEPFRTPEGTGHGRKKRKRKSIFSPDSPPLPSPPSRNSETQTATPPGPPLNSSQVQTDPVPEQESKVDDRLLLAQQAQHILEQHEVLPNPCYQHDNGRLYPSNRPRPPLVLVQFWGQERFEHEIHSFQDLSDFLVDCELPVPPLFSTNAAARLTNSLFRALPPGELDLARRLLAGHKQ
ncbi:WAS/WASL-interacting protein family member 1-like [Haliotis rufescens]|uniref:WAS/WASL-interacting protein family member 1-like n=1 Tax=Haliotis rufescens TaxID=6454 RepID=UPI00201F5699|nr:WAS/WASL-interacting protein family member 1-like [Haliotis rufescens]